MRDRGIDVDHSTIGRWVTKYSPEIIVNPHSKYIAKKKNKIGTMQKLNFAFFLRQSKAITKKWKTKDTLLEQRCKKLNKANNNGYVPRKKKQYT